MLFRYSPYHKPSPRPRFSVETTRAEYPAGVCQVIEQNQFSGCPEDVHLPNLPQPSEPSILPRPQPFVSTSWEAQHFQVQYKSHAFRATAHQEQRIPVDEPELTVPTLSNAAEGWFGRPAPALETMCSQSQQLSEPMDLDCPQQLIPEPLPAPLAQGRCGSAQELSPAAFSPFNPSQGLLGLKQFSGAPQSHPLASDRSSPSALPVLEFTSTPPATSHQGEASLASPQLIPPREPSPFVAGGTQCYQPPMITTHVAQPYFAQLLQDQTATETFTFAHLPDSAIPHFDFSNQTAPETQSCSNPAEINASDNTNCMGQSVSVENVATQSLDQDNDTPRAPLASSFPQPQQVIPYPSSPADSVRLMGELVTVVAGRDSTKNF